MKERIKDLESTIDEQGTLAKCWRNAVGMGMMNLVGQLSSLSQSEITQVKQEGEKKEAEYLEILEKDLLTTQAEGKEKEQHSLEALKEKDAELQTETSAWFFIPFHLILHTWFHSHPLQSTLATILLLLSRCFTGYSMTTLSFSIL